ncbi:hypothetical protein M9H77_13171 [Catharanthus roseus]|uniref:Uncharacterized protein n=1 Tax=Catharanthus roseus TaxID=4058 RepID=A0ACC0BJN6_CATRO|nr:hypothetical protein M9H77_13171 [Catharanthus roseus]
MAREQQIKPRRSLALGLDDHTLSPLARTRYSSPSSSSTTTSSATPISPVIGAVNSLSLGHYLGSPNEFLFIYRLRLTATQISLMLNPLLLPVLSVSNFCPMIHAHMPRYVFEVLFVDGYHVHHFIDELTPAVLPSLTVRSSINQTMENIDKGMTPGTGPSQERKRTRADLKGTSSSKISAKKITQGSLEQYNVIELLQGMGCVELALFVEPYNENLFKDFYANLTEEFGNLERPAYGHVYVGSISLISHLQTLHITSAAHITVKIKGTGRRKPILMKDLSMPSDSWVRALDPLVMPKNLAPSVHKSYSVVVALCIGIVLGNLINLEEFVIMSCDMEDRLRKVEDTEKSQNPKGKIDLQGIKTRIGI